MTDQTRTPAARPLEGDQLTDTVVALLAPTYGQDPVDLDDKLRSFIVSDAHRVLVRMVELGVALVPTRPEDHAPRRSRPGVAVAAGAVLLWLGAALLSPARGLLELGFAGFVLGRPLALVGAAVAQAGARLSGYSSDVMAEMEAARWE